MAISRINFFSPSNISQNAKHYGFKLACAALLVVNFANLPSNANASEVLRIRAIVNDEVISFYDLFQRVRL